MHSYDLPALEDSVHAAYIDHISNTELRTAQLFDALLELTEAVLVVSSVWQSHLIDRDSIGYEYSIYLYERILNGSFRPVYKKRFPWQAYINSNLRSVVYPLYNSREISLEDFKEYGDLLYFGLNDTFRLQDHELHILKQEFVRDVLRGLRMFYSEAEVRRLFAISQQYFGALYIDHLPQDIVQFIRVVRVIIKRLVSSANYGSSLRTHTPTTFQQAFTSSVRSTIFMSSMIRDSIVPRQLLLALDIESLYRLAYAAGGETLRIPTLQELNTFVGVISSVSKILLEKKDINEALRESKDQLQLIFTNDPKYSIRMYISNLLTSYSLFSEETFDTPLVQLVLSSLNSLERLTVEGSQELKQSHPETVIRFYTELVSSINVLGEFLVKIQSSLKTSTVNMKEFA